MWVFEFLKQVSDRLSDQEPGFEFETWTEQQVLAALNAAYSAISGVVPDRFSKVVDISLQLGDVQDSQCVKLLAIWGLYNSAGLYIRSLESLSKVNPNIMKRLYKMGCREQGSPPVAADIISATQIRIYPPVTSPTNNTIRVSCLHVPIANTIQDLLEVPPDLLSAFQEFMLYYLYDIDNESIPNRDRSGTHWANAFTLLGVGNDRNSKR